MDLEDVPEAKSSRSTSPTRNPRVTASRATPQPVAPPPTTRRSRGLAAVEPIKADSWTARDGTTQFGSLIRRLSVSSAGPSPRSLEDRDGCSRTELPPAAAAMATVTPAIWRRRVAEADIGEGVGGEVEPLRAGKWDRRAYASIVGPAMKMKD